MVRKQDATPDGRKTRYNHLPQELTQRKDRDENGALASLNSVAKIPYRNYCQDGVSNTFSIVPDALGKDEDTRINNLVFHFRWIFCTKCTSFKCKCTK